MGTYFFQKSEWGHPGEGGLPPCYTTDQELPKRLERQMNPLQSRLFMVQPSATITFVYGATIRYNHVCLWCNHPLQSRLFMVQPSATITFAYGATIRYNHVCLWCNHPLQSRLFMVQPSATIPIVTPLTRNYQNVSKGK